MEERICQDFERKQNLRKKKLKEEKLNGLKRPSKKMGRGP